MRIPNRDDIHEFVVDRELPLLRLLYFSRWFRFAFVFFVVVLLGVPLSLLKFVPSTPDGFLPVVKVSLLDKVQAWSLSRAARNARDAGDGEAAIHAWRGAIANDPGKVTVCHDFLDLLLEVDQRRLHQNSAIQNSLWLLRLNRTNVTDLEKVVQTFEHYELDGLTLKVLSEFDQELTASMERAQMRALFLQGRVKAFADIWESRGARLSGDAKMQLFHQTYLAGWGNPEDASTSIAFLEEAMKNPELQDLAHRLNLSVSYTRLDAEAYQRSLAFLEAKNLDRPPFHVNYWILLSELDREAEAIDLATGYPSPPRSAIEATMFAEAYIRLGLRDLAFRFLQRYSIDYGSYEGVWFTQAQILISEERWDDLFFLAVSIRDSENPSDYLNAYSYYLEGRAEIERGRRPAAQTAFRALKRFSLSGSRMGLHIATNLMEWKFFQEARDVLIDIKELYGDKLVFWELLFQAANEIGSSRDLLLASESIHRIRPNDFAAKNNFAAMLLSLRIRPDEAITLTFQIMNQDPGNVSGLINHAHALLLNQRVEEAASLLNGVNAKPLIEPLKHGYYLAWFEIEYIRGRLAEANEYREKIVQKYLLPGDRDRFQEIIRGLDSREGDSD